VTTSGAVTEYATPTANVNPVYIAAGPDGALWFTEFNNGKIGRLTTSGAITEYPVPSGGSTWGITAGPDAALWFTESGFNKIGRVSP